MDKVAANHQYSTLGRTMRVQHSIRNEFGVLSSPFSTLGIDET